MKHLIIKLALVSSFLLLPVPAIASGTRRISTSDAMGLNGRTIELLVYPGYDLTIDFLQLNEIIVDATPGDSTFFAFNGLVGNLCPKFASTNCDGDGSRLLRIRQIKPIDFPHITSSSDGSTTLTLVTIGNEGFKVYKFILKKGSGKPAFYHLSITPDPEKPPINLSTESLSPEELDEARERWENLTNKNREVELKDTSATSN